jgi:hypothetical protein
MRARWSARRSPDPPRRFALNRITVVAGCGVRLGYPWAAPEWRNGRRSGLKLRGPQGRPSSNLGSGTKKYARPPRGRSSAIHSASIVRSLGLSIRRAATYRRSSPVSWDDPSVVKHDPHADLPNPADEADARWRSVLLGDADRAPGLIRLRQVFRHLPSDPRCELHYAPYAAPFGPLVRLLGFGPWSKNPSLCGSCLPIMGRAQGGAEVELSMLFADLRGSTQLAGGMTASAYSRLLNNFYGIASRAVEGLGGSIDKYLGDGVFALWVHGMGSTPIEVPEETGGGAGSRWPRSATRSGGCDQTPSTATTAATRSGCPAGPPRCLTRRRARPQQSRALRRSDGPRH